MNKTLSQRNLDIFSTKPDFEQLNISNWFVKQLREMSKKITDVNFDIFAPKWYLINLDALPGGKNVKWFIL